MASILVAVSVGTVVLGFTKKVLTVNKMKKKKKKQMKKKEKKKKKNKNSIKHYNIGGQNAGVH